VRVVAAGVHDVDLAAEIFPFGLGREGQSLRLLHRQGIHVGAQRDHRPGLTAFEDGDDAGVADAGLHLKAEPGEMRGDEAGGPRFLFPEFRVFVDVASPRNYLAFDLCDALPNFLFEVGHRRLRECGSAR
jgi:hypothetical protein